MGIIYQSRFCLLTNTKLMLYYTLIYPYLTYCNIVWASTYPSNLTRLLLMQKCAVWAITNAYYHAHIKPLFLHLGMLDIYQINTFYTANFMFLYHGHSLPSSLNTLFLTGNHIHMIQDMHPITFPSSFSSKEVFQSIESQSMRSSCTLSGMPVVPGFLQQFTRW